MKLQTPAAVAVIPREASPPLDPIKKHLTQSTLSKSHVKLQTPAAVVAAAAAVDNARYTDTNSADGLCPDPCDFSVQVADIGALHNSVPLLKANKLSDGR